jgi:GNAT superfamily N-acetyltransferase
MGELQFRAATPDDAGFYADVHTAVYPQRPTDPVVERYWWAQPDDTYVSRRWVVRRDRRDIGVATFDHPAWGKLRVPHGDIGGELLPAQRDRMTLDAVLVEMERRLAADGAKRIAVRANEDDELRMETILGRGFREDRRHRRWLLDLGENRERITRMAAESRAHMRAEGIRVLTLDQDSDPEKYRKVWRTNEEAVQDVPTTLPNVEESFEDTLRWFRAPDMHEDRFWIARESDDVVGVSVLAYPPVRGVVGTAWTATARRVRGRGIARALKCETLLQAVALGVDRVQTGNDGANDPILHINASMGYRPWVAAINFLKDVAARS